MPKLKVMELDFRDKVTLVLGSWWSMLALASLSSAAVAFSVLRTVA